TRRSGQGGAWARHGDRAAPPSRVHILMRRPPSAEELAEERAGMVERQLRRRGIGDERVLDAMESIPRERFVPEGQRRRAYADSALPLAHGQTISQPWIVAA